MRFSLSSRFFGQAPEVDGILSGSADLEHWQDEPSTEAESSSNLFKTVAWVSAGIGAVALGLVVGREIRQRYKFTRRTPYDFYAHAGDQRDMEFGVGI